MELGLWNGQTCSSNFRVLLLLLGCVALRDLRFKIDICGDKRCLSILIVKSKVTGFNNLTLNLYRGKTKNLQISLKEIAIWVPI